MRCASRFAVRRHPRSPADPSRGRARPWAVSLDNSHNARGARGKCIYRYLDMLTSIGYAAGDVTKGSVAGRWRRQVQTRAAHRGARGHGRTGMDARLERRAGWNVEPHSADWTTD